MSGAGPEDAEKVGGNDPEDISEGKQDVNQPRGQKMTGEKMLLLERIGIHVVGRFLLQVSIQRRRSDNRDDDDQEHPRAGKAQVGQTGGVDPGLIADKSPVDAMHEPRSLKGEQGDKEQRNRLGKPQSQFKRNDLTPHR